MSDSSEVVRWNGEFSSEQLQLLKRTIAFGTSDAEFALFVGTCKRLRLDPFAQQIYCMPTFGDGGKVYKAVVSIDGFRSIAEDTGEYCGQTRPEWFNASTGDWQGHWVESRPPAAARIGILRKGFMEPLVRQARYDAYVQTTGKGAERRPNSMWSKMHAEQLLKCAEAIGLRAAFPRQLSGVYTPDEMGQAQNEPEPEPRQPAPAQTVKAEVKRGPVPAPPPPPATERGPGPEAVQRMRDRRKRPVFAWKSNAKLDKTFVDEALSTDVVRYISNLNALIANPIMAHHHPWAIEHKREVEEILKGRMESEADKVRELSDGARVPDDTSRRIADSIQAIKDGQLADPTDTNSEYGME